MYSSAVSVSWESSIDNSSMLHAVIIHFLQVLSDEMNSWAWGMNWMRDLVKADDVERWQNPVNISSALSREREKYHTMFNDAWMILSLVSAISGTTETYPRLIMHWRRGCPEANIGISDEISQEYSRKPSPSSMQNIRWIKSVIAWQYPGDSADDTWYTRMFFLWFFENGVTCCAVRRSDRGGSPPSLLSAGQNPNTSSSRSIDCVFLVCSCYGFERWWRNNIWPDSSSDILCNEYTVLRMTGNNTIEAHIFPMRLLFCLSVLCTYAFPREQGKRYQQESN